MTAPEIVVMCGDARALTPDDVAGVDVAIFDPPYSAHVHSKATSVKTEASRFGTIDRDLGFDALDDGLLAAGAMVAAHVRRWSVIFADHEDSAPAWRAACVDAGAERIRTVPWIRWSQPQLSGDRPPQGSESILVFHAQDVGSRGGRKPRAKHWNGPGNLTHFDSRCLRGADKQETEKPLDLMLSLVCYFTDPGETVLDLTCGYGTTAQACRLLGRGCVAIDKRKPQADYAEARVTAPLSHRDKSRAEEWIVKTLEEASAVPLDPEHPGAYNRAQARIADAMRVAAAVEAL